MDPFTVGFGGLGLLTKYLNKPKDISHDFNYDVGSVNYDPSSEFTGSISDLKNASGEAMGAGREFMGTYRQMLDPGSKYYQRQFGELSRQFGDVGAQGVRQTNQALASRGIGQGGMAGLLGQASNRQASEGLRKGFVDVQNTGLGYASQFGGLANTAFGQGITGYGQVGGLQSDIDNRALQANLFNTGQQNAANQYANTGQYQQKVGNANARAAWGDSMGNSLFDMAGMYMPNPGMNNLSPGGYNTSWGGRVSDISLKENIELVNRSDSGINIYEFDYKDKTHGEGRYRGVMAQEVPRASFRHENGYLAVDYNKVDVDFERID